MAANETKENYNLLRSSYSKPDSIRAKKLHDRRQIRIATSKSMVKLRQYKLVVADHAADAHSGELSPSQSIYFAWPASGTAE